MPVRHSPAPAEATTPDPETLKRPTSKRKIEEEGRRLQHPPGAEPGSPILKKASKAPSHDDTPDTPSTRATPPPRSRADTVPHPSPVPSPDKIQNKIEGNPGGGPITAYGVEFHHASEAEFARLLNYYGIEWQYEPNQFPLQWHEGRPTEMFSPDFYLPEYDLYIELTTMRQALVRRKNRKLRLLRALYPEINIKLLYRRDYNRLLERFGISSEELEAEQPIEEMHET